MVGVCRAGCAGDRGRDECGGGGEMSVLGFSLIRWLSITLRVYVSWERVLSEAICASS